MSKYYDWVKMQDQAFVRLLHPSHIPMTFSNEFLESVTLAQYVEKVNIFCKISERKSKND